MKCFHCFIILLCLCLVLGGCVSDVEILSQTERETTQTERESTEATTEQKKEEQTMLPDPNQYQKIACVGDSITFGAHATDRQTGSYPVLLQEKLGKDYTVKNFGYGGSSYYETKVNYKPYMAGTEYASSVAFQPDMVIILLGTNDAHSWEETKPHFEESVRKLVQSYAALESEPLIYLCSPLCRYDNPTHSATVSQEIRPILQKVAEEEGCIYVNLYSKTVGKAYMFADKLHPNDTGYVYLADLIFEAICTPVQKG